MSYCHHHIERSQEENKVEVGITVHCALLLVINHSLASPFLNMLFSISCKRQEQESFANLMRIENSSWLQENTAKHQQCDLGKCD